MNNYEAEKAICDAATDGPWRKYDDAGLWAVVSDTKSLAIDFYESDADFIAHFNPQRVLELLEAERVLELLEAERERDELKRLLVVAACPANCDDGAYPDHHGEPVQCQFCYERKELLK